MQTDLSCPLKKSPAALTRSREGHGGSFQSLRRGSREKGPNRTQGAGWLPGAAAPGI